MTSCFQTQGPSYTAPSLPVQESKRSKTSQQVPPNERWTGDWKESTLSAFDPDRWLRTDAMGSKAFDPQSGVQQTFGAGTRGCFGEIHDSALMDKSSTDALAFD